MQKLLTPFKFYGLNNKIITLSLILFLGSALFAGNVTEVRDFIAQGKLEKAKELWNSTPESEKVSAEGIKVSEIINNYQEITKILQDAREKDHDKYHEELNEAYEKAIWQDKLLEVSKSFDFEAEEKAELEKQLQEDSDEFWLDALAKLFDIHSFSERMGMEEGIDPELKQTVVDRCLKIGQKLEEEDKGLDAYSKAYFFIGEVTDQPNKYDQMHDELQRIAILEATYLNDPNSEGVTWEERRKDITLDIIFIALATVDMDYVEVPPYKEMIEKGIHYCQLLTQTEKLEKTFEQLKDENNKSIFRLKLKTMLKKLRNSADDSINYNECVRYLAEILKLNSTSLELPNNVIMAEYAEGMFDAVDTYTHIVWPQAVEDFRKSMTNEFSGIGVIIKKNDEGYIVAESLISYQAPACIGGLDAGDVIMKVDGKPTNDLTTEKAIDLITGPDGTDVVLTVMREGFEEPREFTVTRRRIVVPTVKGISRDKMGKWNYFLDEEKTIGYIRLTNFSGNTSDSMRAIMSDLKKQGMKAMVLDLRSNTGGYLQTAVDVVNNFVREGRIVSSKHRIGGESEDIYEAKPSKLFDENMPLVVLVNSASASASEIVSGALKVTGRAIVVGTQTYGKGSVQTIRNVGFTPAEIKMTIAKYYLPDGRCVHRDPKDKLNKDYGVVPNVKVELTTEQITDWASMVREADTLHRPDIPEEQRTWDVWTVDEVLDVDPQLQTAELILQANIENLQFAAKN